MNGKTSIIRIGILAAVLVVVLLLFSLRLMQLQVVEGEALSEEIEKGWTSTQVIKAPRGEILDRNGRPLASNTIGRDVVIDKAFMERDSENEVILRLIAVMEEANEDWIDNLPITDTAPFRFKEGEAYQADIARLKSTLDIAQYATVDDAVEWLKKRYDLEGLNDEEFRKVAGVRYEMEQRGFSVSTPYTFATDIKIETVPKIKERSFELPGVDVVESPIRQYVSGSIAPHLIGTVGPIYKEEWESYEKVNGKAVINGRPYSMNDTIGKSGAEKAFEQYLKGTDGTRKIVQNNRGDVIDVVEEQAQVPGQTVVLTIDSELQKVAQDSLAEIIETLRTTRPEGKGKEAEAGAVAVVHIPTGEALALATYPSYDLSTYQRDYDQLVQADNQPLFNRALQAAYTPGSTFKPLVSLAALAEGVITPSTNVNCTHIYTRFESYQPQCEGYHGLINVVNAIRYSCNIFFYEVGYNLGIDKIDEYAAKVGLGLPTGIELPENTGQVASPELKKQLPAYANDPTWWPGDVIQASIGQQATMISPLQLANYTATIASGGQRMRATILKSVKSYALDETFYEHEPEVVESIDAPEAFRTVQEGMVAASRIGTAASTFGSYPLSVGSKTGTPERGDGLCNAVFIAYAPAEDPEIAVAVVVEKGWEGYQIAGVARDIFDAYFYSSQGKSSDAVSYGVLLP